MRHLSIGIILVSIILLLSNCKYPIVGPDYSPQRYTGELYIHERGVTYEPTEELYDNYDTIPFALYVYETNDSFHVSSSDTTLIADFAVKFNPEDPYSGPYYFTTSSRPIGNVTFYGIDSVTYSWILAAPTGPSYKSLTFSGNRE